MRWSQETLDQYYFHGGDQRFRLDHYRDPTRNMGEGPGFIVEIGACDGTFTEKLANRFPKARIIAVEPVPSLFAAAQERLQGRENVALTNVGLWIYDGECRMTEDGPASAVTSAAWKSGVTVSMKEISPWLSELGQIDLLVMNIEGAEYRLLPQLIRFGAIRQIENLQIQFHDVDVDSATLMLFIQQELWKTHYPTYMYPFCMENWRLR